jgi:hypothetical protein
MGSNSAETVREIEETRSRLESSFEEFEDRLPAPAIWVKRLVGVALGGGLAGGVFWFAVKRLRGRKKRRAQVPAVVQVVPDRALERLEEKLGDDRWKQAALAVGGAWLLFRLAELRQLRRMNKALIPR